jgi:hypothetical protein
MSAFRVSISRRSSLLGPAAPRGAIVLLLWSSGGRSAARLSGLDGASRVPNMRTRCTERFCTQANKRGWSRRIFFRVCLPSHEFGLWARA